MKGLGRRKFDDRLFSKEYVVEKERNSFETSCKMTCLNIFLIFHSERILIINKNEE